MEPLKVLKVSKKSRFSAIEVISEVGSTNTELLQRAFDPASEGAALVAHHQTEGRGRSGRTWTDAPNSSLLMSVLFRADGIALGLVPLAAGLAVVSAISSASDIKPSLKWPNDVLIDGKKVTGILAESRTRGTETWVVIGMGTNIEPPEGFAQATGLASHSVELNRDELAIAICESLEYELSRLETNQVDDLLSDYSSACLLLGQTVTGNHVDGRTISGRATSISASGELVIDLGEGGEVAFGAGDIHLGLGGQF